jgi:hypothetical protein
MNKLSAIILGLSMVVASSAYAESAPAAKVDMATASTAPAAEVAAPALDCKDGKDKEGKPCKMEESKEVKK